MEQMRKKFNAAIKSRSKEKNSFLLSPEKYNQLIEQVIKIKTSGRKKSTDYWLLNHYNVLETKPNLKKLVYPIKNSEGDYLEYVASDKLFQIIYDTHVDIGHGGRDRMYREISKNYKNITIADIKKFLDICILCQQKKGRPKHIPCVTNPILSETFNSRGQVDLIDFQSRPDRTYKFILVYQENLTKFVQIRALKTKQAIEVAKRIYEIFLIFGAPAILQSDNGKEFCNSIINSLKEMWPQLKMVHGKPRHSESQGSVERANRDIENMLFTWMQDNYSNRWSQGLHMVQFMKNRAFHAGIQRSPYKAVFGIDPNIGLSSYKIPKELFDSLESEEDVYECIESINSETNEKYDRVKNKRKNVNESDSSIQTLDREDMSALSTRLQQLSDNNDNVASQTSSSASENNDDDANLKPLMDKCEFEFECTKCKCPISVQSSDSYMSFFSKRKAKNVKENIDSMVCSICRKEDEITNQRSGTKSSLRKQADRMISKTVQHFSDENIGTTVRLVIPEEDRSQCGPKSILAVILEKKNNMYKLGTKYGILEHHYLRSQFVVCTEKLINIKEVPKKAISLRTSAITESSHSGLTFTKCNCQTKCVTKQCVCLRNNRLCHSKCHNSKTCKNK